MRFLILVSLLLSPALAQKCADNNEFCINIRNCPTYKPYVDLDYWKWPPEAKKDAKSRLCNREKINGSTVLSVCCPSPMNDADCGMLNANRISNGAEAELFQFPWMALLQNKWTNQFFCGGTLISSRYVLTAAHCIRFFSEDSISVRLGEHDIRNEIDCNVLEDEVDCAPAPQDIGVEKLIPHPQYSNRYKKNDIALIRLERPASKQDSVKPICLPVRTVEQRINDKPYNFILSGWGSTEHGNSFDVLRYARVSLIPQDECAPRVRSLDTAVALDQSHICARGEQQENHCQGDSGGPLMFVSNRTSRCVLSGVVQFGLKLCGANDEPGVYTNVTHFIDWIVENVDE